MFKLLYQGKNKWSITKRKYCIIGSTKEVKELYRDLQNAGLR